MLTRPLLGEAGLALKQAVAEGHFRVLHWVHYDSRTPLELSRAPRGEARDGNITLYVRDAERIYNPCLRFYWHTRAVGLECHLAWDAEKCKSCGPTFQWGVGAYATCAHGGGGGGGSAAHTHSNRSAHAPAGAAHARHRT